MQPAVIQQVLEHFYSLIWAGDLWPKTGQKAVCWLPENQCSKFSPTSGYSYSGRRRNLSSGVCSRTGRAVLKAVWMNSVWVSLRTRGEFLKEKEWRNLEEKGSRSSFWILRDLMGQDPRVSCPWALPHQETRQYKEWGTKTSLTPFMSVNGMFLLLKLLPLFSTSKIQFFAQSGIFVTDFR